LKGLSFGLAEKVIEIQVGSIGHSEAVASTWLAAAEAIQSELQIAN